MGDFIIIIAMATFGLVFLGLILFMAKTLMLTYKTLKLMDNMTNDKKDTR